MCVCVYLASTTRWQIIKHPKTFHSFCSISIYLIFSIFIRHLVFFCIIFILFDSLNAIHIIKKTHQFKHMRKQQQKILQKWGKKHMHTDQNYLFLYKFFYCWKKRGNSYLIHLILFVLSAVLCPKRMLQIGKEEKITRCDACMLFRFPNIRKVHRTFWCVCFQ